MLMKFMEIQQMSNQPFSTKMPMLTLLGVMPMVIMKFLSGKVPRAVQNQLSGAQKGMLWRHGQKCSPTELKLPTIL